MEDPAFRDTAHRAIRLGLLLAERSLDSILPAPPNQNTVPLPPAAASDPQGRQGSRSRTPQASTSQRPPRHPVGAADAHIPVSSQPPGASPKRLPRSRSSLLVPDTRVAPSRATHLATNRTSKTSPIGCPAPEQRNPANANQSYSSRGRSPVRADAPQASRPKGRVPWPPARRTRTGQPAPRTVYSEPRPQVATHVETSSLPEHEQPPLPESAPPPFPAAAPAMTLAPSVQFPPGFYIIGLPTRPSLSQLDIIFGSVSALSPALASLIPKFQLAPVQRKGTYHRTAPFFLTHPAFADAGVIRRIMTQLKESGEVDSKGRARVSTPAGVLKVSIATCSVRPTRAAVTTIPASERASLQVDVSPNSPPTLPQCLSRIQAVAYFGTAQEPPRVCICCHQSLAEGEALLRLHCFHVVHIDCMERWVATPHARGRCPECNSQVMPLPDASRTGS